MHPCLPNPIPFEPGCMVRHIADLTAGRAYYSLTYWFNRRAYQTTVFGSGSDAPDLLLVMTIFDQCPSIWTAVPAPVSKAL